MPSSSRSGGLIAAWKKVQIDVVVLRKEKQFIHLQCSFPDKEAFFLTGVYAIPQPALKHSLWQDLLSLSSSIHRLWVLAGDFNDILSSDERSRGMGINFARIDLFHHRLRVVKKERKKWSEYIKAREFYGFSFFWRVVIQRISATDLKE
ncbi:hypothetical protein K1719_011059 [Acacia pycnantha]|nr:hypothetical protein K1719_011059 [Acacia pycnantha]